MNLSNTTHTLQKFIQAYPHAELIPSEDLSNIYQQFIDTLIDHNHLYYLEAQPIISDYEYDQLFSYLKAIEEYFPYLISSASPTQKIIGQVADGFKKVEHRLPLLSLENSYTAEGLQDWDKRIARIFEKQEVSQRSYRIEPKFDGISIELVYQGGRFEAAITRGDGYVWEDITNNIRTIKNFPHRIAYQGELRVRGEVMLPKSQLIELNKLRQVEGKAPFSNTRNAAAGSAKLLDPEEVAKRGLVCFVYDVLLGNPECSLEELGFSTFALGEGFADADSIEQVVEVCQSTELQDYIAKQDYDFDGLVIKVKEDWVAEQSLRELLGATEHHPRWALAYKFPAQQISTQIISIDFQVGRTWIITPVANVDPVHLSGVTISRVSLHNFDFITNKQIKNGDYVWIQRSGEVIPYIVGVVPNRRSGTEEYIIPPLFCPVCNSAVNNIDIHYYCTNPACPAQIKEKILHFVSRDAMDIAGVGDAMVEYLVEQKLLSSVADLYELSDLSLQHRLSKIPTFGAKKIADLVSELEKSKKQPLWRVLNALGIPNVGKKTAQDLAKHLEQQHIQDLSAMIACLKDKDALVGLFGIGEKIAEGIQVYFSHEESLKVVERLEKAGIVFSAEPSPQGERKGSFSLTGSFPVSRGELIAVMEKQGYLYHEQPKKDTEIMLIGERPGSKYKKALDLGIKIYDQREEIVSFFELTITPKKEPQKPLQGGLF